LPLGQTNPIYLYTSSPFDLDGFDSESDTLTIPAASDGGSGDSGDSGGDDGSSQLPSQDIAVTGTIDNYATATVTGDDLTGGGTSYSLDLGSADVGDDDLTASLAVMNSADPELPADTLAGTWPATARTTRPST
jgi:hypothetical protein